MSFLYNDDIFKLRKSILTYLKTLEGRRDLGRNVDGIGTYLPIAFFCTWVWVLVVRSVFWSVLCRQYCYKNCQVWWEALLISLHKSHRGGNDPAKSIQAKNSLWITVMIGEWIVLYETGLKCLKNWSMRSCEKKIAFCCLFFFYKSLQLLHQSEGEERKGFCVLWKILQNEGVFRGNEGAKGGNRI